MCDQNFNTHKNISVLKRLVLSLYSETEIYTIILFSLQIHIENFKSKTY